MGVVWCFVLFEPCCYGRRLPMPAAVTAASVGTAATVEAATAAHCAATNRAATESAADRYM
jgi:hypothetical protein